MQDLYIRIHIHISELYTSHIEVTQIMQSLKIAVSVLKVRSGVMFLHKTACCKIKKFDAPFVDELSRLSMA